MLNVIYKKTSRYWIDTPKSLKGVLIGGERNKILFDNDRQIAYITLTGFASTYKSALCRSSAVVILSVLSTAMYMGSFWLLINGKTSWGSIIVLTLGSMATLYMFSHITTLLRFAATLVCMFFTWHMMTGVKLERAFSLVRRQPWGKYNNQEWFIILSLNLPALYSFSYIVKDGAEHIACTFLSSEIGQAASFVMTSLILIYPSSCYNRYGTNVSTISGFVGVITFAVGAPVVYCTSSHSSNIAIFLLKALPIFFACMEAIYQEKYGIREVLDINRNLTTANKISDMGKAMQCLVGSSILTAGFILGNTLAQDTIMIIIASVVCRRFCQYIGETYSDDLPVKLYATG